MAAMCRATTFEYGTQVLMMLAPMSLSRTALCSFLIRHTKHGCQFLSLKLTRIQQLPFFGRCCNLFKLDAFLKHGNLVGIFTAMAFCPTAADVFNNVIVLLVRKGKYACGPGTVAKKLGRIFFAGQ